MMCMYVSMHEFKTERKCVSERESASVRGNMCVSERDSARGVVVIVVGNGHGDTSSNPGRD